jgi:GNAT superfamily N-acetyltransferase
MNDPSILIRDADPSDAEAFAPLLAELGYPADPSSVARRLVAAEPGNTRVRVALVDGVPAGLAALHRVPMFHHDEPVALLSALVVSSTARKRGIGRLLLADAEAIGAGWGCRSIELTSNDRRADAHAFYTALGYGSTSRKFWKPLQS